MLVDKLGAAYHARSVRGVCVYVQAAPAAARLAARAARERVAVRTSLVHTQRRLVQAGEWTLVAFVQVAWVPALVFFGNTSGTSIQMIILIDLKDCFIEFIKQKW